MGIGRKILIVNKDDKTTDISIDDEIVWQGFVEDSDTLEEILAALDFEVERIDHSFDGESIDIVDEEDEPIYESEYDEDDSDDLGCVGARI